VQAVKLAKKNHIPVIGLSGFRGGKLNKMADAKILVKTPSGEYELVESVHGTIMHMMTLYFKNYFDYLAKKRL
jgi:phosphoheptose isomerase